MTLEEAAARVLEGRMTQDEYYELWKKAVGVCVCHSHQKCPDYPKRCSCCGTSSY